MTASEKPSTMARLEKAEALIRDGKTALAAALEAGFKNVTNFYTARYQKKVRQLVVKGRKEGVRPIKAAPEEGDEKALRREISRLKDLIVWMVSKQKEI